VQNAVLATRHLLSRITADDVALARGQVHVLPTPTTASPNLLDFRHTPQLIRDGYDTTNAWLSAHATAA
jgi:hypothetical protein